MPFKWFIFYNWYNHDWQLAWQFTCASQIYTTHVRLSGQMKKEAVTDHGKAYMRIISQHLPIQTTRVNLPAMLSGC